MLVCLCGVVVACGTRNPAVWGSLLTRAFTTRQIRTVKMCKLTVALTSMACALMWFGSQVKRQTDLAGETYLSKVKEPVHVNENNVMYNPIP